MANQFRNYILTVNNPEQTDKEFDAYLKSLAHIKYFIFQREQGEEKGTPHLQVYLEFEVGKTFNTIKQYFPTAHIESRKGTKKQAKDYCSKEDTRVGTVFEHGTFAEERERTDLTDILDMIKNGAKEFDIMEAYPSQYVRYPKIVEAASQAIAEQKYGNVRRTNLEVTYICGGAGSGKTSYVLDKHGDAKVFRMTDYGSRMNGEKFDNYNSHEVIVFEEFRSNISISNMLNYLDIYPIQLPARFHNKTACYTKVYILTNWSLAEQYKSVQKEHPETWKALLRRIHKVYNFDKSKDTPISKLSAEATIDQDIDDVFAD